MTAFTSAVHCVVFCWLIDLLVARKYFESLATDFLSGQVHGGGLGRQRAQAGFTSLSIFFVARPVGTELNSV